MERRGAAEGDEPIVDQESLLAALRQAGQHPDPALLGRIRALGPAVVPALIALATDQRLLWADSERAEVWAPGHAARLLGELRAAEAVEPLLPLLELDQDWPREDLPEVFGRIGEPAFQPLRRLLFDRGRDQFARVAAANGLMHLARQHRELRGRVIAALVDRLQPSQTREADDATINGFLVSYLVDLHAVQAAPAIRQAYEQERVEVFIIGYDDVTKGLGLPAEPRLARRRPSARSFAARADPLRSLRPPAQPGRNDPCPCGSGKKYKHCHGR